MRHLVIGQCQKAPNFSAFHWSPHGCLIIIGQHFVTTRVVHLPKSTETSLITESDQSRLNHQVLQLCTAGTAWSDSDQAVRAMHSCNSWLKPLVCSYMSKFFLYKLNSLEKGCKNKNARVASPESVLIHLNYSYLVNYTFAYLSSNIIVQGLLFIWSTFN